MRRLRRHDRGSISLELVLLTPGLIVMLLFVTTGGKILTAKGQVQGAARDAARAASLSRANDATADADSAARQTLTGKLSCSPLVVSLDPSGGAPAGKPVAATVLCRVSFADLGLPGFPGHKNVRVTVVSPVDTYVGR